ncbi:MAG TPA: IS701 family transposase [Actinomycetota bacterium]
MTDVNEVEGWARGLDELAGRLTPRFKRVEPRRRTLAYLRGLLAPVQRKNGWQLAEAAGDRTPDGMQDFLGRMRWDAEAVRDDLRAYVVEHLGDPDAVLVLDETGFVKKGTKSVGVQRQYSGTAGRVEDCRIGVFLGYASRKGHALIDRALHLPEGRAADPGRRAEAGVPAAVAFATKPRLGLRMLERALGAGVPCSWVAGDSVYGADRALRRAIEARGGLGYVLAVTSGQRLGGRRVDAWAAGVPPEAWRRLSAGEGAKGPRLYDWAYLPYRGGAPPGWATGLLVRRKLDEPDEPTFHLTLAPEGTDLATLVRVAGTRWTIEACFEAAKGEVGLDQYEVRSWTGWHRHVTLAMLAHAYLAAVRKVAVGGRGGARSGRGAAAAHRAGGAPAALPPALPPALGAHARSRSRPRLVALAPTPPAARPPLPLATPDQLP